MKKQWWKSRTLWFAALLAGLSFIEGNYPVLRGLLGDKAYMWTGFAVAFFIAVLRIITTTAIVGEGNDNA